MSHGTFHRSPAVETNPISMNLASLFNLAGPDLLIILFVVVLLFGAQRLPEIARSMGQAVREFTKAKDDSNEPIATSRKRV